MTVRRAVLSLGSNQGDSRALLREAVRALREADGIDVDALSSLYRTPAWGKTDQPDFVNLAVRITTTLEPLALLAQTQRIENALGRVRHEHWGPRTMDIDIIAIDDEAIDEPTLTVPHPYARQRAFVMVPWREIDPSAPEPDDEADLTTIQKVGQL